MSELVRQFRERIKKVEEQVEDLKKHPRITKYVTVEELEREIASLKRKLARLLEEEDN